LSPFRVLSQGMSLSDFSSNLSKVSQRKFLSIFFSGIAVVALVIVASADESKRPGWNSFPANLGSFHQVGPITVADKESLRQSLKLIPDAPTDVQQVFAAETTYESSDGNKLLVSVSGFENDSAAYSRFTLLRKTAGEGIAQSGQVPSVGAATAILRGSGLLFLKGAATVTVRPESRSGNVDNEVTELARLFASTVDAGEGDIPVLVKHLPNWEAAQRDAIYFVSKSSVLDAVPNQLILKEINFDGGTEAVVANYGQSQLVIVEFTTPQFSIENDNRIWTKISELKSQNQPTPIAYRRVGNYSVFVFNAPDEKTANALVDQVRYEQIVQWLGDDPHMAERLTRYFRHTTSGVLIAVLKSSGLSLILCAGIGGLLGAMLFRHRRAQQAALYSDAGGGTRLNLDELTDTNKSQRLLGPGEQTEADS